MRFLKSSFYYFNILVNEDLLQRVLEMKINAGF